MATYLTREAILAADDTLSEDVDVPEWGGTVRVIGISAAERERLMKGSMIVEGKTRRFDLPSMRVALVAAAIVDAAGIRLFSKQDVTALGNKSAAALDRVADVAMRLAGIGDDDEDEDDDPGKASATTRSLDSPSA